LPSGLVHVELEDYMPRLVRRLMRVELGRQAPQVVQVLVLESTLQLGEGNPPAERIHQIVRIRAILDVVHLRHYASWLCGRCGVV
jgi:hypothetical protein